MLRTIHDWNQHHVGPSQNSIHPDQRNLLETSAEEEEGVNHNRYLASHREQENLEEESHGDQVGEAERDRHATIQGS